MGRKHDKIANALSRQAKTLGLKGNFQESLFDSSFKNKYVFREKNCDILFVYKNSGVPVEVKKTVSKIHRFKAICDLLNGTFELELNKGLPVNYALFVAYKLGSVDQYFHDSAPFTESFGKVITAKNVALAWFTQVNGTPIYVERISREELLEFPLIEELHKSKKNHVNYKRAKKSLALLLTHSL